jgi:predicted Rossmann fold flavoprotein
VIGGGAAGYFFAANISAKSEILLVEKTLKVLSKVKISGGGRCNVTNIISRPAELINYYPRGKRELLGPFHSFNTSDTVRWFTERGVKLKSEEDGRIFPVTDNSAAITDCLIREADKNNFRLINRFDADQIKYDKKWIVKSTDNISLEADYLMIASGSSQRIWDILKRVGHTIISPVPSLFTFNINDNILHGLAGISVNKALCSIDGMKFSSNGPLLITHLGLSGPAILKLSSFAAVQLHEKKYKFILNVNWVPDISLNTLHDVLLKRKSDHLKKLISNDQLFGIPLRLWEKLIKKGGIPEDIQWKDVSNKMINSLSNILSNTAFHVSGKNTFKEEFVTAGGVDLKEVNFKTMESRLHQNLFFAGEVLNIDALTGGFNFQAAWTTAWIAAKTISERLT